LELKDLIKKLLREQDKPSRLEQAMKYAQREIGKTVNEKLKLDTELVYSATFDIVGVDTAKYTGDDYKIHDCLSFEISFPEVSYSFGLPNGQQVKRTTERLHQWHLYQLLGQYFTKYAKYLGQKHFYVTIVNHNLNIIYDNGAFEYCSKK
jgi:hypothetical protein